MKKAIVSIRLEYDDGDVLQIISESVHECAGDAVAYNVGECFLKLPVRRYQTLAKTIDFATDCDDSNLLDEERRAAEMLAEAATKALEIYED